MTFAKKIDIILRTNKLGIDSISALEDYLKVGRGSILKTYNSGEGETVRKVKKIVDGMRISRIWWETGEGEVFEENITQEPNSQQLLKKQTLVKEKDPDYELRILRDYVDLLQEKIKELKSEVNKYKSRFGDIQ